MENKNEFKPYVPAEKITPELTVTSIAIGILLAVIAVFNIAETVIEKSTEIDNFNRT